MYENQTEEAIRLRMLSQVPAGINTQEGDFYYDAVSPAVLELTLLYQQLDEILNSSFVDSAYGENLDRIAVMAGLERKAAIKGSGQLTITMNAGATIAAGQVLATMGGNIRFVATETKRVVTSGATGQITVGFENETAGNLGNIHAGTVFFAPDAIQGFISAVNPQQINAGADTESDEDFRKRLIQKMKTPPASGNKNDYLGWAREYPGVGDAQVIPVWTGSGTVKVVIIDANKQPASAELVAAVQASIDPDADGNGRGKAPIGAKCTVVAAEAIPVHISALITTPNPGIDAAAVKIMFEAVLEEYLAEAAFSGESVSYARVSSILLDCISKQGGKSHENLMLNGETANVVAADGQVAVRGSVTLS